MNIYIRLIAFFAVFLFHSIQGFSQSMTISYPTTQTYSVGVAITPLSPTMSGGPASSLGQTTFTFAGSGGIGSTNGAGTAATFNNTLNTAVDAAGNVYVADAGNHMVRKITSAGVVSTLAGSGLPGYADGTGATAVFKHPSALVVDAAGNVFVSDQQNHRIRKISPAGVVTTVAGSGTAGSAEGIGTGASFSSPIGLALDGSGNLYVADYGNNKIRKITTTGVVSTFAGTGAQGVTNGTALSATFKNPMGIAIDASGTMYVADRQNYLVRKISAGTVSTLAGSGAAGSLNGTGTSASFNRPNAVAVDAAGNVYVADDNNMVIRKITPAGVVTILAGAAGTAGFVNGTGTAVRFNSPYGLSVDGAGNIYTADQNNYVIRKTVTKAYTISPKLPAGLTFNDATGTISGTPTALSAATNYQIQAFNTTHSSNVATISIAVTAASFSVILPSQDQNYVLTYTPRTELLTPAAVTAATSNRDKVQINIEYIDGLGRSLQQVEWQGSPNKRDLVTPIAYDAFGREDKKYLQYSATVATSIGSYKAAAITDQNSFYTTPGTTSGWASGGVVAIPGNAAVSKTIFEASPLSRVLEQGAPGAIYQPAASRTAAAGRTSVAEYKSNLATGVEAVKLWVLTANGASCGTNTYAVNKLYRTIAKDENWISGKIGTIEEYKDFGGKVVLKRVWETETASLSTYYVYDDFGNLRYVIPPAVTATAFTEVATDLPFNQFVYAYHYDTRHRLIEKKIPGKEWEYLVYNVLDQVVLTQDGVQRSKANQSWTATKYDVLGRVIMTGIHTYGATANLSYRAAIQTLVDAQSFQSENKVSTGIGYTEDRTYPKVALNPILSIQYYDDYTAPNMPYNQSTMYSQMTKGLPTASQVNVLGTANRLWMVNYYDNNGRIVKTYKQHYQSNAVNVANYDEVSNTYNFSGELVSGTRLHRNGGVTTTITNTYEYDHMGRKKLAKEKVNAGDEVVLSRLSYNEVGQLSKKELHSTDGGTTFLQNTQYAYHPRGWLKTGTSAQFSNRLKYEDGTVPQYNGNIANQEWGAAASLANVYTYSYDRLDRLLNGTSTGIVMSEVLRDRKSVV